MRRARRLPAGSGTVPMVTWSLQDKARDTSAANVRTGNKLNWEEGGKRNGRKEAWFQVEIPQPLRERW